MLLGKTVEIEINSLNELYEIEKEKREDFKNKEKDLYERSVIFFRGQSDYSWKLEPGIKRKEDLNEWEILEGYNADSDSLFEYIAKCQHYGMKTRFLDFSTDIDIALFFACNENYNIDASLYMCPYMPRKGSWNDTIIISELSLLKNKISVGDFAKHLLMKYANLRNDFADIKKLSVQITSWLNHGFMVLPDTREYEIMKEHNPRIYNQKGAFFICGNQTEKHIIIPKICDIPNIMQANRFVTKVKIPSIMKKDILTFLNKKGIHRDYLLVK